jgi:putative transposase
VVVLRERFGVSQRRACKVIGQHRSTQRLDPPGPADDETELRAWLRAFSRERPRWGWRRAATALRKAGRKVNNKRVQRLWREEGLKVPYRKQKKPHRGIGTAVGPMCPIAPNALWALDFLFDTTVDGRTLKLLNIVDEFTRECPAILVGRHCDADKVVATLDALAATRGAPAFLRFDHGPEFIARAVADWCRFNELLNGWHFDNLLEAQVLIEDWRIDYNTNRPHSAHGDLTPTEFAQAWITRNQPALA